MLTSLLMASPPAGSAGGPGRGVKASLPQLPTCHGIAERKLHFPQCLLAFPFPVWSLSRFGSSLALLKGSALLALGFTKRFPIPLGWVLSPSAMALPSQFLPAIAPSPQGAGEVSNWSSMCSGGCGAPQTAPSPWATGGVNLQVLGNQGDVSWCLGSVYWCSQRDLRLGVGFA